MELTIPPRAEAKRKTLIAVSIAPSKDIVKSNTTIERSVLELKRMGDKKVISSSTAKSTKTVTNSDGSVVETITTTVTEKYADGTTATKTSVETNRKTGKPCSSGSGGGQCATQLDPATCSFPKVENTTDSKFIKEMLDEHNTLRAKHGAPPLTLNNDLGKLAQAWVNNLVKLKKMQHSSCDFGENVYWNTSSFDAKRPVDQWYSEIKDYNFKKLEGQKGTGHFTQVIWKSTKEVGIAMANGPSGYYVVANYNPPGNIIGKYPDNIQPA